MKDNLNNNEDTPDEEEGEEEEEDEEEYNVFFEKDEIQSTKYRQEFDAFEDIIGYKTEVIFSRGVGDPSLMNRIRIKDFFPKESVILKDGKRKPNSKSHKSSRIDDIYEDHLLHAQEADAQLHASHLEQDIT